MIFIFEFQPTSSYILSSFQKWPSYLNFSPHPHICILSSLQKTTLISEMTLTFEFQPTSISFQYSLTAHFANWDPPVPFACPLGLKRWQFVQHCKYNDCTQYSFWLCYVCHCNLALHKAADDCAQSMAVLNLNCSQKKYLSGFFFVFACTNIWSYN